jgi:hypothetical protein
VNLSEVLCYFEFINNFKMALPCDFLVQFCDLTDEPDRNKLATERLVKYLQNFHALSSEMFCLCGREMFFVFISNN